MNGTNVNEAIKDKLVNLLALNEIVRQRRNGWKKASLELRKAMLDFEKHGVEYRRQLVQDSKARS
jgi:hypothetical protein